MKSSLVPHQPTCSLHPDLCQLGSRLLMSGILSHHVTVRAISDPEFRPCHDEVLSLPINICLKFMIMIKGPECFSFCFLIFIVHSNLILILTGKLTGIENDHLVAVNFILPITSLPEQKILVKVCSPFFGHCKVVDNYFWRIGFASKTCIISLCG